jgi:hypothetical protein
MVLVGVTSPWWFSIAIRMCQNQWRLQLIQSQRDGSNYFLYKWPRRISTHSHAGIDTGFILFVNATWIPSKVRQPSRNRIRLGVRAANI